MSDKPPNVEPDADAPDAGVPDPKEAMRQALEAKRNAAHRTADGGGVDRAVGHTHAKASGKRQFRRKAGG